jgi:Transposase DDE domain group 1
MQQESSVFGGGAATSLELRYTGKPVSGWGGLVALMRYLERRGVRQVLGCALPDGRTSPNQIPVVDLVLALFAAVLTGGRRFAHVERLRSDDVVRTILGLKRMPSAMTLTRYFGGVVRAQVEHLSEVLGQFVFGQLKRPALGATLDLDSTVFERYGHQEGSLKGYNPHKHGRPSHHPLLAMLAEAKQVLHVWLRSGNTASARGVKAFLAETLVRVPEDFRWYAVRADSGFFISEFLDELERRELPYAIAVRMNQPLRRTVAGIRQWQSFAQGLEAGETIYQAHGWSAPRRLVVVRELLRERPEARGRKLLEVPGYTFHVLVTTLELSPVQTWQFYNSRAESENRLKELKEDFGADGFCLQSFYGTEAAFRLICFLFNLIGDFKREVTQDAAPRLSALRTKVFIIGGILGSEGHHKLLRLGLRDRWRERFVDLLDRIATLAFPTVAQFTQYLKNPSPKPWKPRRSNRPPGLALGLN